MNRKARLGFLLVAAAATAWLAWMPLPGEQSSIDRRPTTSTGNPAPERSRFAALPSREGVGEARGDPFGVLAWAPAPKQPVPQPAAAQEPPPLPYKYAGTVEQEGVAQHLLVKDERVYAVVQGGTLDGGYRIESVSESEIVLTYLPLNVNQSVPVRSAVGLRETAALKGTAPGAPARDAGGITSSVTPAQSGAAQLRWEGPKEVRAGASFEVALRVTSGEPLLGSPMQLRYDSAMLESVAVRPGRFFAAGRNFSYRAGPDGTIFVGVSGGGAAAADAELLVLTFKPIRADATAELRIAALDLQGASGRALAFHAPEAYRTVVLR